MKLLNESKNDGNYSNYNHSGSIRWNYKIFFNQGECIYDDRHLLYINSEASMVNESTYVQDYSNIIIHWNNKIFFKHGDSLWQKFVKSNHSWAIPKIDLQTFLQPWRTMKYLHYSIYFGKKCPRFSIRWSKRNYGPCH